MGGGIFSHSGKEIRSVFLDLVGSKYTMSVNLKEGEYYILRDFDPIDEWFKYEHYDSQSNAVFKYLGDSSLGTCRDMIAFEGPLKCPNLDQVLYDGWVIRNSSLCDGVSFGETCFF